MSTNHKLITEVGDLDENSDQVKPVQIGGVSLPIEEEIRLLLCPYNDKPKN
jgi:hypothetical protein